MAPGKSYKYAGIILHLIQVNTDIFGGKMGKNFRILLLAAATFLASAASYAQTTGSLTGTVTDPNAATIPGATVTARNNATGEGRTATTNDSGVFTMPSLTPGVYTVSVEIAGFKRAMASDVIIEVSKAAALNVTMEVGLPSETVTVTASQEIINSTSPTLTNVIDTKQIVDLPLGGRNPLELAGLQAGIAVLGTDVRNASVSGLRGSMTNVTQDGINAMDNFVKTSSFFALTAPSLNSTAEFSITTGTVGSDAGRGAAQVNLVTRGGTNELHGGIFYLHRNDFLNANNFFSNLTIDATTGESTPRARERQHFFGFDVGGPLFFPRFGETDRSFLWDGRDTAHWFFSYEGFRENFSTTRNRTVLTPEARTGLFRYNVGGVTRSVNVLNIGNVGVLNPVTMAIINSTPLPNNADAGDGLNTAGYRFNVNGSNVSDKYVGRYDHHIVKNSRLGGHKLEFVYNTALFSLIPDTFNGLESPFPGGTDAGQTSTRTLWTTALVSTFGNISNTFRYGRQWAPVSFTRLDSPTEPFIFFSGITNVNNTFMSQGREVTVNQFSDNMVVPKGNHVFRFGADIQRIFAYTFNDAGINQGITLGTNSLNPSGILSSEVPGASSSQLSSATSLYANLVGNLASSSQTLNVQSPTSGFVPGFTRERTFSQTDVGVYAQDQWRFRSNLTLNLGLRWEFEGVPTIPNGLAIQADAKDIFGVSGFGNLFTPNAPAGAAPAIASLDFVSGDTGIPLYNNDWNNFAPFIGFAYSPSFKSGLGHLLFGEAGKSSIRMGYSISYTREGFTVISNAMGVGTTNAGLIQSRANTSPTGVLTEAGVALPDVSFQMPITDRQNNLININNSLWTIDPNLRTPYVQQWNVGIEREIFKDTALEIRYAGNRALKLWRAVNYNEVNIFENGFLEEFLNARRNYEIYTAAFPNCSASGGQGNPCRFGNSGLAGQVDLPIFSAYFAGRTATNSAGFASSGFINNLINGAPGTAAFNLAWQTAYRAAREDPANGIPANFFVANPNALNAIQLTNDSMSNYHSLQVELRRRFSAGLQFQADYTWSKSMNNAQGNQASQSDLYSYWTLRDKRFDYARSSLDSTHRFVANGTYDLPIGRGRRWMSSANALVDRLFGGWTIGTIVQWQTRPPFYFSSSVATFNQFAGPAQLLIPFEEFKKNFGVYKTPGGVFFFNPELLDITTNARGAVTGATLKPGILGNPAPGEWGNFPINSLNGPNFFNVDISLVKRVPITESVRLELKTNFLNAFNHANFIYNGGSWNSTQFGRITGQSSNPRVVAFQGSVRF